MPNTAATVDSSAPVRHHLAKFQAPIPFEVFVRTVNTPRLAFLNCCMPRFLDAAFRLPTPRLRVVGFPCSLHSQRARKPSFVLSRPRLPCCAASSVAALRLNDGEMSLAATLSWCPKLTKLVLKNASELAFWTLLNCGHVVPELQVLAVSGTYAWTDVRPLLPRLVRAFPHLHTLAYGHSIELTDTEHHLMAAALSALVTHPFTFVATL